MLPVVWGVSTFVFLIIHLIPGDPIDLMLGETATQVDRQTLRRQLGLDQPLWQQYMTFLQAKVQGYDQEEPKNGRASSFDCVLIRSYLTKLCRDTLGSTNNRAA